MRTLRIFSGMPHVHGKQVRACVAAKTMVEVYMIVDGLHEKHGGIWLARNEVKVYWSRNSSDKQMMEVCLPNPGVLFISWDCNYYKENPYLPYPEGVERIKENYRRGQREN